MLARVLLWLLGPADPGPDHPSPWGYDTMPADPKPETHACEGRGCTRAGTEAQGVRFDRGLGVWICNLCWANTPTPGPGRPGR